MSIYVGTALQPSRINKCLYGHFLKMSQKHVIFVRDNRLEVAEYDSMAVPPLRIVKEITLTARVVAAVEVKLTPSTPLLSLALLTSKDQLYIYSFLPDGKATVNAFCMLETGSSLLKSNSTSIIMEALDHDSVIIHNQPGCVEIVQWTVDAKNEILYEVRPYRRDNAAYHLVAVPNTENHFAIVEREGSGFVCRILAENSNYNRLDVIIGPIDITSDIMQLIPLDAGVLAVSSNRYTLIAEPANDHQQHIVRVRPATGRTKAFAAHCPLNVANRWLMIEETGEIYVLAMDLSDLGDMEVELDYVGIGPVPNRVTILEDGHFFISGLGGDHNLIRITQSPENSFDVEVSQVLHNMAPILDMVTIENRSDTKLVTATGTGKHGAFRIVKNCISVRNLGRHERFTVVPKVFSLSFLDSTTSLFACGMEDKTYFLHVDHISKSSVFYGASDNEKIQHFSKLGSLENTFYAGVIEPNYYIQMNRDRPGIIFTADSDIIELPTAFCGQATRYGDVLFGIGNRVEWHRFDPVEKSLVKIASQKFPTSIAGATFADPENPDCRLSFIYLHRRKTIFLMECKHDPPTLNIKAKIPVNKSKVAVDAVLATFSSGQSFIVLAMDDGSIDFHKFDLVTGALGPRESLNIGMRPPKFCKTYVQGQLHLLMCSDQTTAMRCERKSVTFCNVDIKEVGFVLPLATSHNPAKNNKLLYHSEDAIQLGMFVNKQRMTTQTIPIEETVEQFIYNKKLNIIVAATSRTDLVTVKASTPEAIARAESVITKFETAKDVVKPRIKPEFEYPCHVAGLKAVYGENRFSVTVFCADRISLLDVLKMSRFEEVTAMTTGSIGDMEYLLVATQILVPGEEHSENCRILIYRLGDISREDTPSVLTYLIEKQLRNRVFAATFVDDRFCLFTETNSVEYVYDVDTNSIEQVHCVHVGHFIHVSSAMYSEEAQKLAVSDIVSATMLVNNCAEKWGQPSVMRQRSVKCLTAMNFVGKNVVLGVDSHYVFSSMKYLTEADAEEMNVSLDGPEEFIVLGDFYMGDVVNAIRPGIPFLPSYAQPKGMTTFQRTWCSTGGGVGVIIGIDYDVFKFLKGVELAIDEQMKLPSKHVQFRAGQYDYAESNVIDGDFLKNILEFEDPNTVTANVKVPQSLLDKNPGVQSGLLAFFYLKQLWAFH